MTAPERAELEGHLSWVPAAVRMVLFCVAVSVAAVFSVVLQGGLEELLGRRSLGPLWVIPTLVVATLLFRGLRRSSGALELRRLVIADIVRGEVAVHRIHVSAALEVPKVEDEGPILFVRDADGETLFFAEPFTARVGQRGFPWAEFTIEEAPASKHLFGIRSDGPPLGDTRALPPLGQARMNALGMLSRSWGTLGMTLNEIEEG